jgi:Fic family protein
MTIGAYRTKDPEPMRINFGFFGRDNLRFKLPPADKIKKEMDNFFLFVNNPPLVNPILKAGIAHFWLLSIYPFEDGCGKLARAVSDLLLCRADETQYRYYSVNQEIEKDKNNYYSVLLAQHKKKDADITLWLDYYLNLVEKAIDSSKSTVERIIVTQKLIKKAQEYTLNSRQTYMLKLMLREKLSENIQSGKYAEMTKCSRQSAFTDLQELVFYGLLTKNVSKGRSSSYKLAIEDL